MSKTLSTRSLFAIAKTYGAVVTMSAITNAAEAVATLGAGHSVIVGDFLEVTSGWGQLNNKLVRVKTVATNDITFEGMDTSSTTKYPAGTGTGSIRRVTAWENITQVKDISSSGGDQQFTDGTSIDDDVEVKIPTIRSATTMDLTVYDDPSLAWYATVSAASDSSTPAGLRITTPSGSKIVANAYWSLSRVPQFATNAVLTGKISMTYAAQPVRYAS
jgi:hypothetical protein